MGRKEVPLFKIGNTWYARWHTTVNGKDKNIRLSTGTTDHAEAIRRYPIVTGVGKSWVDYQKMVRFSDGPATIGNIIPGQVMTPPLTVDASKDALRALLEETISNGRAMYDAAKDTWHLYIKPPVEAVKDPVQRLSLMQKLVSKPPIPDETEDIKLFYRETVNNSIIGKDQAETNMKIWFLWLFEVAGVKSWSQITEELLNGFREWRLSTPIKGGNNPGKPPSTLTVQRHMDYLSNSFNLAVKRGKIKFNPIEEWAVLSHQTPLQDSLTKDELLKVFSNDKWQQTYLFKGKTKVDLGYRLLDYLLLLFASCKRRKEIIHLKVGDINFSDHNIYYEEFKNSKRGNYQSRKAFYLTPAMERLLKRVVGNRPADDLIFPAPPAFRKSRMKQEGELNGEYISDLFECVCKTVVLQKKNTPTQSATHCYRYP